MKQSASCSTILYFPGDIVGFITQKVTFKRVWPYPNLEESMVRRVAHGFETNKQTTNYKLSGWEKYVSLYIQISEKK